MAKCQHGGCVLYRQCQSARKKAWHEANREKEMARKKAWHEANREKVLARKKAYYEANREKELAGRRVYHKANREKELARMKAYRRSPAGVAAQTRHWRQRLQAGMARKADLIRELEAQLGITPQQEVAI